MGSVFAGMAVINLIRYFGDDKSAPSEQKAEEDGNWSGSPVDKEAWVGVSQAPAKSVYQIQLKIFTSNQTN